MRLLRAFLVLAGLASIVGLVAATGPEALLGSVRSLSWRVAVFVVFPYAAVALLHTVGWKLVFHRTRVPLGRLFTARLAGEALNASTASVGGEPVKAYLLRPVVGPVEASAALLVEKTSITVGQVLFFVVGFVVSIALLDLPARFREAMGALLAIQVVAVGGFVLAQLSGVLGLASLVLARFGVRAGTWSAQGLRGVEEALATTYVKRPGRVLASVVVHLAGWITGSLEVYLVLHWLHVDVSLTDALVIDAFGTGIKFLGFAIPGALGVLEGGYMLVFSMVGLGSGLGLSFTLLRRLRMILWTALGVLALTLARPDTRAGAAAAECGVASVGSGARWSELRAP